MYFSLNPLDVHVGMYYRVTKPEGCGACLPPPRERSFVVVEDHGLSVGREGGYCVYVVGKRGLSSHEAAGLLARRLGVRASNVALLGLKDAEATTVQAVCLPCPGRVERYVRVGGVLWARLLGRVDECPRAGRLRGNRFTILLEPRGCTAGELAGRLRVLLSLRLPAYYSYQRFGTRRPNTHIVGLLILRGELGEAQRELVGNPYPDESPVARRCRLEGWVGGECRVAWAYEARLAGKPPEKLVELLPPHVVRMLSSAVQAYLFNLYLSLRIMYGYRLEERVKGERLSGDGRPLAFVPGVGYRLGVSGEARRLLREALELAGLSEELLARAPGRMRSRPYWRPTYTTPSNGSVNIAGGRVVLRFSLERGMYATLLLRELVRYPDELCREET